MARWVVAGMVLLSACAPASKKPSDSSATAGAPGGGTAGGGASAGGVGAAGGGGFSGGGLGGGGGSVAGTGGIFVDLDAGVPVEDGCEAAARTKQSIGCEYYATMMDSMIGEGCFAVFVANTSNAPAHLTVGYGASTLDVAAFTRIPEGFGTALGYRPYEPARGIAPDEVAILFLSGPSGEVQFPAVACPVASALPEGVFFTGTGLGRSFRITTDVPVVAYQMNPYGGAGTSVTGASLLLPTSAWDTNYVIASAFGDGGMLPSLNVIAQADGTRVTIVPTRAVTGGKGVPASNANVPFDIVLGKGEQAQISQEDLTGSVLASDRPVGLMAGHQCMYIPDGVLACDHGEQMVPLIRALGSEYVGVMHRPRGKEPATWRVIGAADGTTLTWSSDVGGPKSLELGEVALFTTRDAFVVKSQDEAHPFLLFAHMLGVNYESVPDNAGDPDSVLSVPPEQYLSRYVFFTDPTYPETNLVVVRRKVDGRFADVTLDCGGPLGGWTALGEYEWTRTDLVRKNFESVGGCSTGRHVMESDNPFGLWVWGWGSSATAAQTTSVSYGYPAGMNVEYVNPVVVPPEPR
ncbi:MAG TPA: IgGFc-binding protein [Polyangiaceae bacterium]|nr:IgGFc-binding protein [Polyangiaceae bacterium]